MGPHGKGIRGGRSSSGFTAYFSRQIRISGFYPDFCAGPIYCLAIVSDTGDVYEDTLTYAVTNTKVCAHVSFLNSNAVELKL